MEQQTVQDYKDYIEQIDLQRYWLVLKRRWFPALALSLLPICAATYFAAKSDNTYEASGQVLLKAKDPAAALAGVPPELATQQGFESRVGEQISILSTQQTIMTSSEVLDDVIANLNLKDKDGKPLSPVALREKLTTEAVPNTSIIQVTYQGKDPELAAAIVNGVMDAYVDQNIANNRAEARAAREFIEEEIPRARENLEAAARALSAFRARNDIVSLSEESAATVELLRDLENDVRTMRAQLANTTSQANILQEQLGLTAPEAKELVMLSRSESIREVVTNLSKVQNEIAIQGARYTENHPVMTNLRRQEQALIALLNDRARDVVGRAVSQRVGDFEFSPIEENLTTALLQAEAQRSALEDGIRELEATREDYRQRSASIPALEREDLRLVNELENAQKEYNLLAENLQQVRLVENQTVGTAQIQERADIPTKPVSNLDRLVKILFAGIVGGVLSGIALAFLLDLLDKTLKTVKDAEVLLQVPVLGVLPTFAERSRLAPASTLPLKVSGVSPRLVTLTGYPPEVAAAYQLLQANLGFIAAERPLQRIVISSAIAAEGKSEVCANLAVSMAQAGRRVLIIDADMRSPSQHHLWNVPTRTGLSQVLSGHSLLETAVYPLAEHLDLLPAGEMPANPLALIDSSAMETVLQKLLQNYDMIFLDSPPLVGAADAAILGKLSDGVLWVVRPRHLDASNALAAKALLQRSGAKLLGLVANGVNMQNEHADTVAFSGLDVNRAPYRAPVAVASPSENIPSARSLPLSR